MNSKREKIQIANNITLCTSFFRQGTGLMFRFPKGAFAYVFPFKKSKKLSITMWFVFYAIDILFLDESNRIVHEVSLRPFTQYAVPVRVKTFIELPKGTIKKHHLLLGQKLSWSKDSVDLH